MIEIKNMMFAYSASEPVFEAFNWKVEPGDAWAVIGPSGCGKTTLLYLLAGLYQPDSGSIAIEGIEIAGPRPRSGLVLQDHGLLPWSTVLQNARLGLTIREFYGSDGRHAPMDEDLQTDEADRRVRYWLEKLRIAHLHDMFPAQLSRGQRQRTAIARTLATQPDLLILDEPFSALDAPTREDLQNLVIDLHRSSSLTYIIVTHDIEVAAIMGRRILILNEGTNRHPRIIENNGAVNTDYRYHVEFRDTCENLHHILGDLV
jgi:NitT/TauT family transport system ATP-binding protein